MKNSKRALSALLVVLLLLSLAACGKSDGGKSGSGSLEENMATLVQGNLDELYLGQFNKDFIQLLKTTEDDCRQVYEENLEINVEYFARSFNIEFLTDELKEELTEFYKELYSHAKYTVGAVSQMDEDHYVVNVEIAPIDVIQQMDEAWDDWMAVFYEEYGSVDYTSMSDEEYQKVDAAWARFVLDLAKDKLANLGYLDNELLAVQIAKNEDGRWSISENDIYIIDERIVYFP